MLALSALRAARAHCSVNGSQKDTNRTSPLLVLSRKAPRVPSQNTERSSVHTKLSPKNAVLKEYTLWPPWKMT